MANFLGNLLTMLQENMDAIGMFALGIAGIIGKWLVTARITVDLLFINYKPLFYKILEAKKARGGGGSAAPAGANPAAAAGAAAAGVANAFKSGGMGGIIITLLSYLPNIILFGSYVDPQTGEIKDNEASNATMKVWFITKAPGIIVAAAFLSLVSAGLFVNASNNLSKTVSNRASDIANMVNTDGLFDSIIGNTDNLLIADNDETLIGKVKREAIDKAMNQGISSSYKYSADNRTNVRNYLEREIVEDIEHSDLAKLNFVNTEYNSQIMTYSVSAHKRSNVKNLAESKNAIAKNTNKDTDYNYYIGIEIPQENDGKLLCDDKKYETVEVLVEIKVSTTKTASYFNAAGTSKSSKSGSQEKGTTGYGPGDANWKEEINDYNCQIKGKLPKPINDTLKEMVTSHIEDANPDLGKVAIFNCSTQNSEGYVNIIISSGQAKGCDFKVTYVDGDWEEYSE